jgi:hypothetical protein
MVAFQSRGSHFLPASAVSTLAVHFLPRRATLIGLLLFWRSVHRGDRGSEPSFFRVAETKAAVVAGSRAIILLLL